MSLIWRHAQYAYDIQYLKNFTMNHRGDCLTEITFVREVPLFHLPLTVHQLCITSVRIHLPCSVTRDNPHQQGLSKSWCAAQSSEKKTLIQLNHHWTSPYLWKKCAATFSSIHFDSIIYIIYIYLLFGFLPKPLKSQVFTCDMAKAQKPRMPRSSFREVAAWLVFFFAVGGWTVSLTPGFG